MPVIPRAECLEREWKEGRKEGRKEGWMDGWMDGWNEGKVRKEKGRKGEGKKRKG